MKKFLSSFLLTIGCASMHAQLFSISPSLGISRTLPSIKNINATSLGKLKPGEIRNGLALGLRVDYLLGQKKQLVVGYNSLECGYGSLITPTNGGRYTSVAGFVGSRFHQFFFGYSHSFNLLFESKTDKLEKKNGWNYDTGDNWLKLKLGIGPSIGVMTEPVDNLSNHFAPGTSFNNDSPELVWVIGKEKPRYIHQTNLGVWFTAGLTFVKKNRDKMSLDFVMNIGLQTQYIIETNNQFGNTRTGQLIREEQFDVVSKGTSMALMLSYPIYFGKRK